LGKHPRRSDPPKHLIEYQLVILLDKTGFSKQENPMSHKRPPIPVIILLALAILAAGYYGLRALLAKPNATLSASGTIEAVEIVLSPEISGKVSEVLVDEGSPVQAGDVLFKLDDSLLQDQRAIAQLGLETAQLALHN
jgi:multidrug efflux pump subunit AcrA (membrane-fusion protein)